MLKIDIKATDLELTDAITAAVEKKIGGLDKYLEHVGTPRDARVELGRSSEHHHKGLVFEVRVNLHVPKHLLRAEVVAADLYEAIDLAKDALKREIDKAIRIPIDSRRDGVREAKAEANETELI